MAGEKFYLNFISDGFGEVEINEPFGFSSLKFDINQKDNGYGRDIFFNGGEALMEFGNRRNHYLDRLLYYFHYYGFEANAKIRIQFSNGENVIMDLDFYSAVTDDLEYFKCKCIEISDVQIVKRRASVKVDLFSNKDIDYAEDEDGNIFSGSIITPVPTQKMILKPKMIKQASQWSQVPYNNITMRAQGSQTTNYDYVNPCANIVKSDLKDTLSWFEINANAADDFYLVQAHDNLTDINISIKKTKIHFTTDVDNGGDGYVEMKLYFRYGADLNSATSQVLLSTYKTENQTYDFDSATAGDFTLNIPSLNRGDKIWIYFEFKIRQSASIPDARFEVFTTISNMETYINASSKTYHSTGIGIRLIDAVKQVVKSISGKDVNAPVLDSGSLYFDTFLLNGNLLRGITNKPFYLSLEDLEKSLSQESNGDFETDDKVFFGREEEYYNPIEIWFFDNTQFSDFNKKVNDRFAINEFNFKFSKFQSEKENVTDGTADIIHGQSIMTLFNKMVENKRDITVDWVRDASMIEEERIKSLEISDQTSTQDDDTIFAIDTIANTSNTTISETALLFHEYNATTQVLSLRSKVEPNFKTLGININDSVKILTPDKNAGNYIVVQVYENSLELKSAVVTGPGPGGWFKGPGQPTVNNNGERLTSFEYTLTLNDFPYKNRTNELFSNITGIWQPENFSNLRFSVRRVIENNYNRYLATSNFYWKETPIKTTYYKNNRAFSGTYNGLTTIEGVNYIPSNPMLSSWIYENAIFANVDLEDVIFIRNALKSQRGFIRCIDKTGNVIKIYPKKMSYDSLSKELNIMGEGKFEPMSMLIESDNDGFITINKETSIFTENFIWEITDHKLFVFDNHRQRLYNGVFWDLVSINGGFAKYEDELKELLNLL